MSFVKARERISAAPVQVQQGPEKCAANGCPCVATVQVEGGRWSCSHHAFAMPDLWPRITESLNQNAWLLEFMRDVQAMARRNENWREFATKFWDGVDDQCMPANTESDTAYFYRMKGEVDWRCGQRRRPIKRELIGKKPAGKSIFDSLVREAA